MSELPSMGLLGGRGGPESIREESQTAAQEKSDPKSDMGREWSLVKEKVANERARDRWDSAIKTLQDFAVQYPGIRQEPEFERELAVVKALQAEADSIFRADMNEAKNLLSQGRIGQSLGRVDDTFRFYPERKVVGIDVLVGGALLLLISLMVYLLWSSFSARRAQGKGIVETPKADQPD